MAARKPLVINAGQIEQLQAGDTLDASVSEVDVVSKTNDNASPIVIGSPVYQKADGDVDLGRANAQGTVQLLGLVKDASIAAAASGIIQTDGILAATTGQWDTVTGGTGGLTPGSPYYLDAATAGKLTLTAPTSVGQFVVRVGLATSTTEMDISITPPIKL
jgi:hypothetical protein